ncbi:MAG TPA: hypothetical protein VOA87_01265 [Thermoanaerobaculia bacterium]|nr:hypothetical protein [Thermoanaerobaculia bacterium]
MVRKSFAWLIVAALAATAAGAQTADELIEKNVQAKGGREKLKAVQSVRMSGKMEVGPGAVAPFTLEMKRPHKVRIEFTVQGMTGIQAYDGAAGWMVMPFMGKKDPEAMPADELKEMDDQADFEGPLVDYKAKGHQVELVGKQDLEGTPAWKFKVTKKNGDVTYLYLDADAFLEVKEEGKRKVRGQDMEFETIFGDYKPVEGVVFPHSIQSKAKGAPAGQTITVDKIEINPEVADGRFAMPKVEKKEGAAPPK